MKLKILAKDYQVKAISQKELQELMDSDGEDNAYSGVISTSNSTIYILNDLDNQEQRLTIIHEILHAIYSQYGDDCLNDDEEHINRLSTAITQVLIDNKTLLQMFMER